MGGPGAEIICTEGAGKALDGSLGEGRRVGATEDNVEFVTHDFDVQVRGAIALVIRDICVVVGKVKVRCDVTRGLSSETNNGQSYKVRAQILCGYEEVTSPELVTGTVHVCRHHTCMKPFCRLAAIVTINQVYSEVC